MNTLGNNNIFVNNKMARDKPTLDNVVDGFLITDIDWDGFSTDNRYKKVEILWITKDGSIKSRKINYLSNFHKSLMRKGLLTTTGTPFIRTKGGYLKKRIQTISLKTEEKNKFALKNDMIGFKLNNNQTIRDFKTGLIGVMETLKLVLEVFVGENVVLRAGEAYYTLNDSNVNNLQERINGLMIHSNSVIQQKIEDITGSDREFLVNLNYFTEITVEKLDFVDLDVNGDPLVNPGGLFFKHHHIFKNLNLDKYGIFRNDITEEELVGKLNVNCLIRALTEGGMNEVKLGRMKAFVFNRNIPMCKIKIICELLKIHIEVKRDDNNNSHYNYGKEFKDKESYSIGLIDQHYFIIDKTKVTKYAIKNIFNLQNKGNNWGSIIDKDNHKKYDRYIDSYNLIKFLFKNKETHLVPIEMNLKILKTQFYDKIIDNEILEYEEDCCKPNVWDQEKEDWKMKTFKKPLIWFDFETDPNSERHLPFICCSEDEAGNKKTFLNDYYKKDVYKDDVLTHKKGTCKYNCGKKFLDSLTGEKVLLIAHNAGYDYRFLVKYLFNIKQITKGSGLMNATAMYKNSKSEGTNAIEIEIKDSYKLISMPLSGFANCFKLDQTKEVMPYNLYTQSNIKKKYVPISEAREHLKSDDDYNQLKDNVNNWKIKYTIKGIELFDIIKYSEIYCRLDVSVLKEGYLIFRGWLLEAFKIDINFVWTIASLANKVLLKNGCYDGVEMVAGMPRMFIQKCVVGGRTMCRDNKKYNLPDCNVADYDATSLYPAACVRLGNNTGGFLMGKPKVLKDLTLEFLQNKSDGYFIKIKINAINKHRHFSLISAMNDAGVRVFDNDVIGKEYYVDKTTLEDWIEFHKIEFEIIKGYYYNEGRNNKIASVMSGMFNERLKKKSEGNPIQVVYKLIMNASYGKAILKPITTDEKVINTTKDKDRFVQKNYNSIVEYQKLNGCDKWVVKVLKPINEHFNNAPVGVEILSMSKRIMNEVMCLSADNDLKIYYQDTDSLHIDYDDVEVLEKKFKEKYNRTLTGNQLGQFHIDFDLEGSVGAIKSINSIFLGKKCYIDELESLDQDGNKVSGYHIRMKGVPNQTIKYTAEKRGQNLLELYQSLYDGEAIEFDLLCGGARCNFKFHKDMTIESLKDFKRTLKF